MSDKKPIVDPSRAPGSMETDVAPLALEDEEAWAEEVEEEIRRNNPDLAKALDRLAKHAKTVQAQRAASTASEAGGQALPGGTRSGPKTRG